MKHANTLIMVIVLVVVLLAALGIGVGIREIRERRAHSEVATAAKAEEKKQTERVALPGGGVRPRSSELTTEERERQREGREDMRAKWESMSEEEKREFIARRPGTGGPEGRQQGQRRRPPVLSDEERAKMEEMRERWDSMTEEEKAEAREQMRRRFEGRQRPGAGPDGGGFPEMSPEERERRRAEAEERMREEQEPIP